MFISNRWEVTSLSKGIPKGAACLRHRRGLFYNMIRSGKYNNKKCASLSYLYVGLLNDNILMPNYYKVLRIIFVHAFTRIVLIPLLIQFFKRLTKAAVTIIKILFNTKILNQFIEKGRYLKIHSPQFIYNNSKQ